MGAITTLALAAIDTALWEPRAHAANRPLYVELGGARTTIPTYARSIDLHLSPAEIGELLAARPDRGYNWLKVEVGLPPLAADAARVEAARVAVGADGKRLLDANQAWDFDESVRRCRAFERFDPTWIEEPMAAEDVGGHAELRRKAGIPVAIGESLYTIEQFRAYTRSWLRPAADADAGTFRVWATDAGPPSHSVPPHLVAKAAAALGKEAFGAIHERLLHGYFAENRDITDTDTLAAIWREAGLPPSELAIAADPELLRATIDQHNEAIRLGVNGVPAVLLAGNDVPITGALPLESYRRWIERALAASPA